MQKILVVDDMAVIREPIALALQSSGFQTLTAENGATALEMMKTNQPDLVLLDLTMPKMDGLAVLKAIRGNPSLADMPVILLTGSQDKELVVQAARLGVKDYVLKANFTIADLLTRIRKNVSDPKPAKTSPAAPATSLRSSTAKAVSTPAGATATLSPDEENRAIRDEALTASINLASREDILARIERLETKTLPGAVSELLGILCSSNGTVVDAAHFLRRDPVLSARVLGVANSAAYVSRRACTTNIEDAVRLVGLSGIRNLISSVAIFEFNSKEQQHIFWHWEYCLAVASIMEKLASTENPGDQGLAYIVGLCHDLPEIMLYEHFSEEMHSVDELARISGRPKRQVQTVVFGMPYSEMVGNLLHHLGLPSTVTTPIREFVSRVTLKINPSSTPMCRLLQIASIYSHGLMLGQRLNQTVRPFSRQECRDIAGTQTATFDPHTLRSDVLVTAAALANRLPQDVSSAARLPSNLRLAYIRDTDLAEFDPLHVLLQFMAEAVKVFTMSAASNPIEADGIIFASLASEPDEIELIIRKLQRIQDRFAAADPASHRGGYFKDYLFDPGGNIHGAVADYRGSDRTIPYPNPFARRERYTDQTSRLN